MLVAASGANPRRWLETAFGPRRTFADLLAAYRRWCPAADLLAAYRRWCPAADLLPVRLTARQLPINHTRLRMGPRRLP